MASAARAYERTSAAPRREQVSLRVVPGGRTESALSPQVVFLAKMFMVALAIFAVVAFLRIGLASATVTTTLHTEEINAQVIDLRSGSAHLEVTESTLSNPVSIKTTATGQLGMKAPTEVDTVVLEPDVVVYDAAGNLSLARSLSADVQG